MSKIINFLLRKKLYLIILAVILAGGGFYYFNFVKPKQTPNYLTEKVKRGILVDSVSVSGQIVVSNIIPITTQSSGIVKEIFVKEGDEVSEGAKILEISLDQSGIQAQAKAWSAYLSAKVSLDQANQSKVSLQKDLLESKITQTNSLQSKISLQSTLNSTQASLTSAQIDFNAVADRPENDYTRQQKIASLRAAQDSFNLAQQKYNSLDTSLQSNQQAVNLAQEKLNSIDNSIAKAQSDLNYSWLSYNNFSATVFAPITGKIADLNAAVGEYIQNSQSSTNTAGTRLSSVKNEGNSLAIVNLAESDSAKVKIGQKAILTLDSLADKTFTGYVVAVDRIGTTTNNVTSYPAIIRLDTAAPEILPNMAVNVSIIIETKSDVLLVPSAAIQTQNGESFARILKNGQEQQVPVQVGLSSAADIEIVSGLAEGDEVITGTLSSPSTQSRGSSVFSGGLGGGAFRPGGTGGGGQRR